MKNKHQAAFWQSQRISDGKPSSGFGYKSGRNSCGVTIQPVCSQISSTLSLEILLIPRTHELTIVCETPNFFANSGCDLLEM